MRNQYFKFVFKEGNAYLHFYPPLDGGETLGVREVTSYLEHRKYGNYDLKAINACLNKLEEESEVLIGPWDGIEVSEFMDVEITRDKMNVVCRFYPASSGGRLLTAREVVETLTLKRVRYGLKQQTIFDFFQNREYCKDYVFAKGRPPVQGKDAKIEYFFNTKANLQPKRNEDGSVNYKELNTISHVKEGDLLARLVPEDLGKAGKNVMGEEVLPHKVRSGHLEYGQNISTSEDGNELFSDVTGHASLVQGKVFVSNVFEVPADVDNSTGNIDYDGSVLVHGNVKSGFSVQAQGDIIVEGLVEGAYLLAGGQIVVKHGIHGMLKGKLYAGTNLMAKYIENAYVSAGGYVEAEIVLNSEIDATDAVRVKGKKGLISGGCVRAGNYIEAENIGTDMGTSTQIEVGVDPDQKERYLELSKQCTTLSKDLEDDQVILDNYMAKIKKGARLPQDKMKFVQSLAAKCKAARAELEPMLDEMQEIRMAMLENDKAYLIVTKDIFPGVNLGISDLNYSMKEKRSYCKIKKQEGEIKFLNI